MAVNLERYFQRIGFLEAATPTLATLRSLHFLHPQAIPFENLDVLLREPVSLTIEDVERKLVDRRRGGYCYEHNTLFGAVLEAIGFKVTHLAARVEYGTSESTLTTRTHSLLDVEAEGERFLVDVGFSGITLSAPLLMGFHTPQVTPHEWFRIPLLHSGERRLEALVDEEWKPVYRFDSQPQARVDDEMGSFWVSNHPNDIFTTTLIASRVEGLIRHQLIDNELTTVHPDGRREERLVTSTVELGQILERVMKIKLPSHLRLDAVLRGAVTKKKMPRAA